VSGTSSNTHSLGLELSNVNLIVVNNRPVGRLSVSCLRDSNGQKNQWGLERHVAVSVSFFVVVIFREILRWREPVIDTVGSRLNNGTGELRKRYSCSLAKKSQVKQKLRISVGHVVYPVPRLSSEAVPG